MTPSRLILVIILMLALLAAPIGAQSAGQIPRVGALIAFAPPFPAIEAFRQGLRDLGYVEGATIALEVRYVEGRTDRYRGLIAEMTGLRPDVIVVWGTELAQAVRRATSTIPRSSSRSPTVPWRWGWSPAWPGPAGTSRGSRASTSS